MLELGADKSADPLIVGLLIARIFGPLVQGQVSGAK
jgi:hypothetical protein